ncbi:MAG: ATP-binding protein [Ignavibacteria bacterium]
MDKTESGTAYVNGTGKVHLHKKLEISSQPINQEYNKFYYQEILKLLINIHQELISIPGINVYKIFSVGRYGFHKITKFREGRYYNMVTDDVYVELEFIDVYYLISFQIQKDRNDCLHYILNYTYEEDSIPDDNIGRKLLELAFRNTSKYKTGCLNISFNGVIQEISNLKVDKIVPPSSNINNVFINENIKIDISRFIHTFKNYHQYNFPLRYLLSGRPGLGKTEVIRSVIEECSKYGTVIIPKKMEGAEWLMFDFAKLFKPAIICIDDIDLLFGKREEGYGRKTLSDFLTELDGILENKVFLIATTNDKKLVDFAASRPGRFDEVIDFGDFERRFYLKLIENRTQDEDIINLFNEEAFDFLESNKVSGAYIVNLVKQLKIIKDINTMFSKDNLIEYLKRNYKGFYKSQVKENKNFGFGN